MKYSHIKTMEEYKSIIERSSYAKIRYNYFLHKVNSGKLTEDVAVIELGKELNAFFRGRKEYKQASVQVKGSKSITSERSFD